MADVTLRWNERDLLRTLDRVNEGDMKRAAGFLRSSIRRSLNRPNPEGKNPAPPGQPPRKISGALRNAIFFAVSRDGREVVAGIGIARGKALHGRDLELGNPSKNLEPRPFLRPALLKNRRQLARLMAGGSLGRGRRRR